MHRLVRGSLGGVTGRLSLALDISSGADIVQVPFPGRHVLFLTHPDDVRRVLQGNADNYRKSFDYRFLAELMGEGLVTSEGELWRKDRRMLQPAFHHSAMQTFAQTVKAQTARMLDGWRRLAPGSRIDVFAETMRLTVSIIGLRIFSADVWEHAQTLRELMAESAMYLVERSQAPVDVARFVRTPARRRFEAARAELRALLETYLAPRWYERADPARADLVEVLKASGVSREAAMDHVITLLLAGHETTAGALGWCLHALSRDSALQTAVAQDLSDPERCEAAVDALVCETLRRFPPLPVVGREALEDDVLGGVAVPKGSSLVIFIYGTHHREDLWSSPERFQPERFTAEKRREHRPGAYLPFGLGPRACVGAGLAMLELKTALKMIVPQFRVTPDLGPPVVPVPMIALRADRPVMLGLEARSVAGRELELVKVA
jgi:cytochrome P450